MALPDGDFTIILYQTPAGTCPVREFLELLAESDPGDHAAVAAGLSKLKTRINHREPLSKAIGGGLFELRHVGKLNTRIIWFFRSGRRIVAVHGIRNKGTKIPAKDLEIARVRMRDWIERNSDVKK